MRVVSLASGSGGNAYVVEHGDASLLIDCGISYRELLKRCNSAAVDPARFAAVLVTHNHGDHVKGLETLHKRRGELGFYANAMTAEAISSEFGIPEEAFVCFENGQDFELGPFTIHPFSVPHDVPDPVGYLVTAEGETYFHATDVGTPLDSIGLQLAKANFATLESNHDAVMLHQSDRRESLKQRIRGPRGHLSNDQAAELVRRFASPRLRRLALAHLSRDCNAPHLAENEMHSTLSAMNRDDVELKVYAQDFPVTLIGEVS